MRPLVFGVLLLLLSVFTTASSQGLDDVASYAEQLAKQRLFAGMLHVDQGKALKTPQLVGGWWGGGGWRKGPTHPPSNLTNCDSYRCGMLFKVATGRVWMLKQALYGVSVHAMLSMAGAVRQVV
jgi:hypothetical protein